MIARSSRPQRHSRSLDCADVAHIGFAPNSGSYFPILFALHSADLLWVSSPMAPQARANRPMSDASPRQGHQLGITVMIKATLFVGAAAVVIALLSVGARAQGTPQTVDLVKVDVTTLAAGYRASKMIGSSVVNDGDETIGKIDDLLVSADGKRPYAVLSIGGFLGMGSHLVVVPYESLKFVDKKVALPGGTIGSLKMLPEFTYATE